MASIVVVIQADYRPKASFATNGFHKDNDFSTSRTSAIFVAMSTLKEIEAAITKLSRAEIEEIREWIDDYLEDQLELTDGVKAKLNYGG